VLNEDWEEKCKRIRQNSPYGSYPTWRLLSVIVKSGADLRQEQLACQLIQEMHNIWQQERLDLWVYNFRILVTSNQGGLIETIPNTISVHSLKKQAYAKGEVPPSRPYTLYDFFRKRFGQPSTERYQKAQQCFMRSLAGYSLATYILAIKDRHNGNILIDSEGHISTLFSPSLHIVVN
jgi:phosphatidylinositol 4-kinase